MWVQIFLNAFSLGSFYALVAMGFALIFGVTHAFNLAHGELVLLGGYLAYWLTRSFQVPFYWTLPFCMLALALGALLLHLLVRKVREPFELNSLVLTFGVALILQNGMLSLFSADYRLVPAAGGPVKLPGFAAYLSPAQAWLLALSLGATAALYLLLKRTFFGKALRATIQNREAAELAGVPIRRMRLAAFVIGGSLVGLAGPLFGQMAYLHPAGGMEATLVAIVVTIFAGIGQIRGILLGGWILGLAETLAVYWGGASWRELVSGVLLILFLLWRPEGVLAPKRRAVP